MAHRGQIIERKYGFLVRVFAVSNSQAGTTNTPNDIEEIDN